MARVKITSSNIFAGAGLKKVEAGSVIDVEDETAVRWINAGLAESVEDKKADTKPTKKE